MPAIARRELDALCRNALRKLRPLDTFGRQSVRDAVQHGQRLFEVCYRTDLNRIVAADLGGIDVDELGWRKTERVLWFPGAAIGFGEARAQREHPVRAARLLIDEPRSPEARHAEYERMVVGQRALAHQRVGNRDLQLFDELVQIGRCVREHDATAHVQHRPLRGE